jgi:hypothetical protein
MPTREYWHAKACKRIGLMPNRSLARRDLLKRNARITEAYAELYLRRPAIYKWAGMAALTSSTVGRGMYLMLALDATRLGCLIGLIGREAATVFEQLCLGNWLVFADIYWQHLAYEQAGIEELAGLAAAGQLDEHVFRAWQQIDQGRQAGQPALIWAGNIGLLKFEQERVLQPGVYAANQALWDIVADWVPSPIPTLVETFRDFHADGNIGVFEERWRWIERRMLPRWKRLSERQDEWLDRQLRAAMKPALWFSLLDAPASSSAPPLAAWRHMSRVLFAEL